MRYHFLTVPVWTPGEAESELNAFLAAHRILTVDRQFVSDGGRSAWALCIAYIENGAEPLPGRRGRIDYRELLPEAEFAALARLRALRKELAEQEAVPPYAIFSNDQLAEMVKRRARTLTSLGEIAGVGEARLKKYGKAFLETLVPLLPAEGAAPEGGA